MGERIGRLCEACSHFLPGPEWVCAWCGLPVEGPEVRLVESPPQTTGEAPADVPDDEGC